MGSAATMSGPPYAPTTSFPGELPTVSVDVAICAVFIAMYLACAVTSLSIFRYNLKRGHKFLISGLLTGFCMARVLTNVLRIAWATSIDNVSLEIAATLFLNLGVFLLYIINVLFAQRILRAKQPNLGWHRALHNTMTGIYVGLGITAVVVISFTVLTYYTRDMSLLTAARDLQLTALTYLLLFVLIPFALLAVAWFPHQGAAENTQQFGHGSLRAKSILLLVLSSLMVLLQGFKYGTAWIPAQPMSNSPWYHSRAAFYCLGFMLEIIYLICALGFRVDLRFHVPDGSSKRRTYDVMAEDQANAKERISNAQTARPSEDTVVASEVEKDYDF